MVVYREKFDVSDTETVITSKKKIILIDLSVDVIINNILIKPKNNEFIEIWYYDDSKKDGEKVLTRSRDEMNSFLEVYRLYDFSDKVIFISDSNQYGTLFNYVKTGILTEQEMVDALLYKI